MSAFTRRPLGKTGLMVSPIGIGGGSGISSPGVMYAFEHGINYFFFSSDLHHYAYQQSSQALRHLCGRGSAVREQVCLATVSYITDPDKVRASLLDQFLELGIDYIDVFHWGWITDATDILPLVKMGHALKRETTGITRFIRQISEMQALASDINMTLMRQGLARYVGASFHSRTQARTWMRNLDVLMLRYNLAHLGAEQDVVPHLFADKTRDPGMVVFNVAHDGQRYFHQPPEGWSADLPPPSIPDCYRFALSQPWVDLVLTGLATKAHIDEALQALEQGPLSSEECQAMRRYGAVLSATTSP